MSPPGLACPSLLFGCFQTLKLQLVISFYHYWHFFFYISSRNLQLLIKIGQLISSDSPLKVERMEIIKQDKLWFQILNWKLYKGKKLRKRKVEIWLGLHDRKSAVPEEVLFFSFLFSFKKSLLTSVRDFNLELSEFFLKFGCFNALHWH